MGAGRYKMIRIKGWLIHQTQKAILVRVEDGDEIWLPLSQINYTVYIDNLITVSLPMWLAEAKNVVHLELDKCEDWGTPMYVALTESLVEEHDDCLILEISDKDKQVETVRLDKKDILYWELEPRSSSNDDETRCTVVLSKDRAEELQLDRFSWGEDNGLCLDCCSELEPFQVLLKIAGGDYECIACEEVIEELFYQAGGSAY